MSWTRRLAVTAGLAVAAAGIAVPLSLSTPTASAAGSDRVAAAAVTPASLAGKAPRALRDDLRAAWAKPDGQRVAALQAVLQKALAGDYGTQVQQRAQRLQARLAAMDPQLRSDLLKAIDLPKEQRHAALKAIREKLRAGGYGEQAKRDARILRHVRRHRLFG